jgi:hypothetical protein
MSLNLKKYQEFTTLLEQLRGDLNKTQLDASTLRSRLSDLQHYFLQEIALFTDLNSRQQSYQTEISKQLRLLEVDGIFLQGAKQTTTIQARLKTIEERLNTLIRYCQAILHSDEKEKY